MLWMTRFNSLDFLNTRLPHVFIPTGDHAASMMQEIMGTIGHIVYKYPAAWLAASKD